MATQASSFAAANPVAAPPAPQPDSSRYPAAMLQGLIDQACCFNLFTVPGQNQSDVSIQTTGGRQKSIGIRTRQTLHRCDMTLDLAASDCRVRGAAVVGEPLGWLDFRWMIIPHEYPALPGQEPPSVALDPTISQRFVMQEMIVTFGDDEAEGFSSFGTGRTFPMKINGRAKLIASAVGNITLGAGKFRGHEGNFTLCGELLPDKGFLGHIVVRIADPGGTLRVPTQIPPVQAGADPDPEATYLFWTAQKGTGADQANSFSLGPDGNVRGLNIPTQLKRCFIGFAADPPAGFRSAEYQAGEIIGREVGFGRGSFPDAPPTGTPLSPYQFEGVAEYSFFRPDGRVAGSLTTNVIEGRRFDLLLPGAPGETAWRFGFFGPVVLGAGCFAGAEGMFYGASSSVFRPPPGDHIITHLYFARLNDPKGRYRAALAGSRW